VAHCTIKIKLEDKIMGFSLESFFEQLFDVLDREQKAGKTVKQLREKIENQYKYAEQCGYINKDT